MCPPDGSGAGTLPRRSGALKPRVLLGLRGLSVDNVWPDPLPFLLLASGYDTPMKANQCASNSSVLIQ
jgi:hypothetical protein